MGVFLLFSAVANWYRYSSPHTDTHTRVRARTHTHEHVDEICELVFPLTLIELCIPCNVVESSPTFFVLLQKAIAEMPDGASFAEFENAVALAERRLNAAVAKAAQAAKDLKDHEEKLKVCRRLFFRFFSSLSFSVSLRYVASLHTHAGAYTHLFLALDFEVSYSGKRNMYRDRHQVVSLFGFVVLCGLLCGASGG